MPHDFNIYTLVIEFLKDELDVNAIEVLQFFRDNHIPWNVEVLSLAERLGKTNVECRSVVQMQRVPRAHMSISEASDEYSME